MRAPTDEEIAAKLGVSQEELDDALLEISRSSIGALDELWSPLRRGRPGHARRVPRGSERRARPEFSLEQTEVRELIGEAIAALPEREKLVITLYYYEELTLREIGEVLGVTESRVSQLHTKAILRLKARLAGPRRANPPSNRPPRIAGTAPAYLPQPAEIRIEESYSFGRREPRGRNVRPCQRTTELIRNVAVVGHRGTGKTSLVEALLFQSEATNRLGTVEQGSTVADWDEDEHKRQMSLSAAVCHLEWRGTKINLIDAPGDAGFQADTVASLRVVEGALVVSMRSPASRCRRAVSGSGASSSASRASSTSTCSTASARTSSALSRGSARSSRTAASRCSSRSGTSTS